jgi:hypothetical protein
LIPAPGGVPALLADRRYLGWSALAGFVALVAFGLVSAIIPNPVFGREIPPEPFAIATWLASAVLMGLLAGTYLVPPPAVGVDLALPAVPAGTDRPAAAGDAAAVPGPPPPEEERRASALGYAGGVAAFLAIGCPVCNKVALVLLGTSGALTIWAPLQPLLALASLGLLAVTLAWRLRLRARGNACPVA